MACADDCNRWTAQKAGIAANPQHRRRIVDLAQAFRVSLAAITHNRRTQRARARPLGLGRSTGLAIENILRGFSRKIEPFEFRESQLEDAGSRTKLLNRVKNAFGTEARRQRECEPGKLVFIQRFTGSRNCLCLCCHFVVAAGKSSGIRFLEGKHDDDISSVTLLTTPR